MREVALYCTGCQTRDDFYDAFFAAVGAPSWHGRNFDALNDSICTGSINEVEIPYKVVVKNSSKANAEAQQVTKDFAELIARRALEGCEVSILIEH
jgi:RNAse (barnase) inhibitor barstar